MTSNKKYGLILSEKANVKQPMFQATHNVFGDDTDSDDESNKKPILLRPSDNINRQSKITQQKAISEDPTVYQYDEIYDSMTSKKEEKKEKSREDKKPKYIDHLMKAANKRKIENERRLERQIQKEREQEGEEFADKEVFVTSAYKKKLEEMKHEEEKEKYEEYLESIGDVTKQKDLGGFYRHLYEQKLGIAQIDSKNKEKEIESNDRDTQEKKDIIKLNDTDKSQTMTKRNYRKRKSSTENNKLLSEGEIEDSEEEINRCNLEEIRLSKKAKQGENIDADSDFSVDESSDDENNVKNNGHIKQTSTEEDAFKKPIFTGENEKNQADKTDNTEAAIQNENNPKLPLVKKIDIWKKRTVGEILEQALKRYYERKASRGG